MPIYYGNGTDSLKDDCEGILRRIPTTWANRLKERNLHIERGGTGDSDGTTTDSPTEGFKIVITDSWVHLFFRWTFGKPMRRLLYHEFGHAIAAILPAEPLTELFAFLKANPGKCPSGEGRNYWTNPAEAFANIVQNVLDDREDRIDKDTLRRFIALYPAGETLRS